MCVSLSGANWLVHSHPDECTTGSAGGRSGRREKTEVTHWRLETGVGGIVKDGRRRVQRGRAENARKHIFHKRRKSKEEEILFRYVRSSRYLIHDTIQQ